MENIDINEAAEMVKDCEVAALEAMRDALDALTTSIIAIREALPSALNLDASRIADQIEGSVSYIRSTTLPQVLALYQPATLTAPSIYPPLPTGGE